MEQTRANTWHLHVDGMESPTAFKEWCRAAGFAHANFCGHPEGYEHFEPVDHWTMKFKDRQTFQTAFAAACVEATKTGFVGYLEGEYIARVVELPDQAYIDEPLPFRIERRRLQSNEGFRQGELHLTFEADSSDPRRIRQLLEVGLYGAYEMKDDGLRYLVLTMQGYMADITRLAQMLERALNRGSGLARARLKIERAVTWQLFGIEPAQLPPIAAHIT